MFKNIFIRFLKLTILTVLLLLMFGLTFYMSFRQFHRAFDRSPFANPFFSITKTVSMSIGELGYDELFRQPTDGSTEDVPGIPFPEISYILWIIFIILMPILFGNLLVKISSLWMKWKIPFVLLELLEVVLQFWNWTRRVFHFISFAGIVKFLYIWIGRHAYRPVSLCRHIIMVRPVGITVSLVRVYYWGYENQCMHIMETNAAHSHH